MKIIIKLAIICTCMTLNSCKFFGYKPPVYDFYCQLNGKDWQNKPDGSFGGSNLQAYLNENTNWLFITARKNKELISLSLKLPLNNTLEVKTYYLQNNISNSTGDYYPDSENNLLNRNTSIEGTLIISKKEGNNIWGTFEFITETSKSGTQYVISKGQFNKLLIY